MPSRSVVSDSLWPHGLQPARLLCPWDFPGKNTRVGCHSLLQGNLPDPGIERTLVFCNSCIVRWILYHQPPGKPNKGLFHPKCQQGSPTPPPGESSPLMSPFGSLLALCILFPLPFLTSFLPTVERGCSGSCRPPPVPWPPTPRPQMFISCCCLTALLPIWQKVWNQVSILGLSVWFLGCRQQKPAGAVKVKPGSGSSEAPRDGCSGPSQGPRGRGAGEGSCEKVWLRSWPPEDESRPHYLFRGFLTFLCLSLSAVRQGIRTEGLGLPWWSGG